jgi:hypothetical protein
VLACLYPQPDSAYKLFKLVACVPFFPAFIRSFKNDSSPIESYSILQAACKKLLSDSGTNKVLLTFFFTIDIIN